MVELRLDPVHRDWVVTGRRQAMPDASDSEALCPFCPGNERFTPQPIYERRDAQGAWQVRVFHDRAPLFRVEGKLGSQATGMFDRMNAVGAHEVVDETPQHGKMLGELSPQQIAEVLETYRQRVIDLKRDRRFRYVSVVRHQRRGDPAWEEHSHAQILATPMVPMLVERELRWSLTHYLRKQRCLYCDILQQETQVGLRIVDGDGEYVCLCPYAARFPYEVWVIPAGHNSCFEEDLSVPARLLALAAFLKVSLLRMQKLSYRMRLALHTEPNLDSQRLDPERWQSIPDGYHWHLAMHPELDNVPQTIDGEGICFNPVPAEEAAATLREFELEP